MNKVGIENVAVSILHDNLSENEAYEFEIYYIYLYREEYGYNLANVSLGGKGLLGFTYIRSDETRKKLSNNNYWRGKGHLMSGENHPFFGKKHSEEARKKMSKNSAKYWKGKKLPEETRLKLKENCYWKGKKLSEEMKLKISNSRKGKCTGKDNHNFGKPLPESTKKKISEALSWERSQFYGVKGKDHPAFGYKHTPEARKKISEANIGRKQSEEFVEKLKAKKRRQKSILWKTPFRRIKKKNVSKTYRSK